MLLLPFLICTLQIKQVQASVLAKSISVLKCLRCIRKSWVGSLTHIIIFAFCSFLSVLVWD